MTKYTNIYAILSLSDGAPVLLDAFAGATCRPDDEGSIHVNNEQYNELEYSLYPEQE